MGRQSSNPLILAVVVVSVFFCSVSGFAAATSVTVSSRTLIVAGQPFTVRGVSYSPTPISYTLGLSANGCSGPYQWWMNSAQTYGVDFPLIERLGANTIRAYNLLNSPSQATQITQMLDAARDRNLYVILGYYVQTSEDFSDNATRTRLRNEVVAAVNLFKDHPAVLMWAVGNEVNLNNGNNGAPAQNWYTLLNLMAGDIKAADPRHPVMSVEGECLPPDCGAGSGFQIGDAALNADDTSLTNLDLWGANAYRGRTFGTLFTDLAAATQKPILITEFGKDAWRDSTSAVDPVMQADYIASQWNEIQVNVAAFDSAKALAGGVVFEWSDEWWKHNQNTCFAHETDTLFRRTDDTTDPNYQDEWFGLVETLPSVGTSRTLRQSYSSLQALWNPSASGATTDTSHVFDGVVRNFPNPFRTGDQNTRFVATVTQAASVDIQIFDAGGAFVTSLVGSSTGPGRVEVIWDGRNRQGERVAPGLYVAKIEGKAGGAEDRQYRRVVAVR